MKTLLLCFLLPMLGACASQPNHRADYDGIIIAPVPPPQYDAPDIGGAGMPPSLYPYPDTPHSPAE